MPSRKHRSSFSLFNALYFHIRMELQIILPIIKMASSVSLVLINKHVPHAKAAYVGAVALKESWRLVIYV